MSTILGNVFEMRSTALSAADYICANLSTREYEKNKYGEVFTPYSYICDGL